MASKNANGVSGSGVLDGGAPGLKSVRGISTGVKDSGQRKAVKDSGYPGMMDTRPQESDITKSARD